MKKLIYPLLCLSFLVGCSSKKNDATPNYSNFTAIGGDFSLSRNGAAGYSLSNLELKIQKSAYGQQDVYRFRGGYNGIAGYEVDFYLDQNRTGAGPWPATIASCMGFTSPSFTTQNGFYESDTGTLSQSGDHFSGHFATTNASGTMR